MMNEELILKRVAPYVKNNSIKYKEFEILFNMLEIKEQYKVVEILYLNNIELCPDKDEKDGNENEADSKEIKQYINDEIFMDSTTNDELETNKHIKQSNEVLCSLIQQGNKQAMQDLCIKNKRLVDKCTLMYIGMFGNKLEFEDLEQIGYMGLIKAAKRYEISKGYAFSTYAIWWIKQAISRGIYDTGFTIRVPVHMMTSIAKIQHYEKLLDLQTQQINYEKKLKIIAKKMDKSVEFVRMCIKVRKNYLACSSLNVYIGEEDTELEEMVRDIENPLIEDIIIEKALKDQMNDVLLTLTPREKNIIELRFGMKDGKAKTLEDVGKIYGITRERVRQIEAKALRKMRHPSRSKVLKDFLVG